MIESKEFCKSQVSRLAGLGSFPGGKESIAELVIALQAFDTQEQAEAWVSGYLSTETFCPVPATIRRAAYDTKEHENTAWLEAKRCPDCGGSGFRLVRRTVTVAGVGTNTYDFATRCNHES